MTSPLISWSFSSSGTIQFLMIKPCTNCLLLFVLFRTLNWNIFRYFWWSHGICIGRTYMYILQSHVQSVYFQFSFNLTEVSRILSSESANSDQKFVNHGLLSWNRPTGKSWSWGSDVPTRSKKSEPSRGCHSCVHQKNCGLWGKKLSVYGTVIHWIYLIFAASRSSILDCSS